MCIGSVENLKCLFDFDYVTNSIVISFLIRKEKLQQENIIEIDTQTYKHQMLK